MPLLSVHGMTYPGLCSVQDVLVAVQLCGGGGGAGVAAVPGLRQAEAANLLAGGEWGNEPLLLLLVSVLLDGTARRVWKIVV